MLKDEKRRLVVPGDYATTLAFCVQHWLQTGSEAIRKYGGFAVALSGGSTPKAIYENLAQPHHQKSIDWSKVWLFWSDERAVPPDHPDSNFRMAMEAGFGKLPIPHAQILRMHAEVEIEKSAKEYEETIKKTLKGRPFDLIMLGMGDDGHTASLFPYTAALKITDRLVVANEIPQKIYRNNLKNREFDKEGAVNLDQAKPAPKQIDLHKSIDGGGSKDTGSPTPSKTDSSSCFGTTWRMTMTFPCINAASISAIYVLGAAKKERLAEIFRAQEEIERLPSQGIGTKEHPALWIADLDAASLLSSEK